MLLPHAQTLCHARSAVAALADRARTVGASSAYERVLIELDRIHGDECPALETTGLTDDRETLTAVATSAIEKLTGYGVDALGVELILVTLDEACRLDDA